jgi:hypothetical protein
MNKSWNIGGDRCFTLCRSAINNFKKNRRKSLNIPLRRPSFTAKASELYIFFTFVFVFDFDLANF